MTTTTGGRAGSTTRARSDGPHRDERRRRRRRSRERRRDDGARARIVRGRSPATRTRRPASRSRGDNGGKTTRGVDAKTIKLTYRLTTDPSLQDAIATVGGGDALDSPEAVERTAYGLIEYFNSRFQFYGRKLKLVPFQGRGQLSTELLGGGQDAANNDAIKVAKEVAPFADVSAVSQPYSDALSREKVHRVRCAVHVATVVQRAAAVRVEPRARLHEAHRDDRGLREQARLRLPGRVRRRRSQGQAAQDRDHRAGQPRVPGVRRRRDGEDQAGTGTRYAARESYTLDIASLSSQAASLVAKLSSQGITTVACACDPILPIFMTAKAREQGWTPEWIVLGTALTDVDIVGQLYDQEQWSHAFGLSALGKLEPLRGSFGYQAYKSVRKDEPALIVDLLYYSFYLLAIGVHMAGPNLTPETFEKGMFAYPGGDGIAGRWKFGPGDYTPMEDAREIWWDPEAISIQNGEPGAYRGTSDKRYTGDEWPRGAAAGVQQVSSSCSADGASCAAWIAGGASSRCSS